MKLFYVVSFLILNFFIINFLIFIRLSDITWFISINILEYDYMLKKQLFVDDFYLDFQLFYLLKIN